MSAAHRRKPHAVSGSRARTLLLVASCMALAIAIGLPPATVGSATGSDGRFGRALAAPQYNRESAIPVAEDPYITLPKARYRVAPSLPVVTASAGNPGTGTAVVTWIQTWLGRGEFGGFVVSASPGGTPVSLAAGVRTFAFRGLAAGTYTFTVTAIGFYQDMSARAAPVHVLPAPRPAACIYLIDVDVTTQSMVASHCGAVFIQSPITGGRPGFRSPLGTFYTSTKSREVIFHSPYPVPGTPGYYPPTLVKYAIRFYGLYYLHTWAEPVSAFGPGSQNGPYASLGCIHIPDAVMAALYAWAPNGTTVHIHT
jgi:lipoprotein-anchoring transpeptidase ErfK/SrfK